MKGAICIICTEQFDSTHNVSALKCGHIFHGDCLSPWLAQSMTCPQCRQKVVRTAVIHKLYFSRPDLDDSIAGGEPNAARELSRVSSKLEETQNRLCLQDREMSKLLAEKSAVDDRVNQITESHRLSTMSVCVPTDSPLSKMGGSCWFLNFQLKNARFYALLLQKNFLWPETGRWGGGA